MTKRVRWACPNGCASVLGPQRPRLDDVARFCLGCSAKAGKLVRRTAPALEAERERHVAAVSAKDVAKKSRAAEKSAKYFTVHGVDLRVELEKLWRLPVALEQRRKHRTWFAELRAFHKRELPKLVVRNRNARGAHVFGRAWSRRHEILINRMPQGDEHHVRETLAHEVAHVLAPGDGHGMEWKTTFRLLCEQAYDVRPIIERRYHGNVHPKLRERAAAESADPGGTNPLLRTHPETEPEVAT